MSEPHIPLHLRDRVHKQLDRQEGRKPGSEWRLEAVQRLFEDHIDMDPYQFEAWLELLESEERAEAKQPGSTGGACAWAAALIMMDVRDARRDRMQSDTL